MARGRPELASPWTVPMAVAALGVLLVAAAALGGGWEFTPRIGLWDADIPEARTREYQGRTMPPPELNGPVSPMPLWFKITLGVLAVAALAVLVYLIWQRRPRRLIRVETTPIARPDVAGPDVAALQRAAQSALDLLDRIIEPKDAVVRCWLALELAAQRSGAPRDPAATPTEFTAQVLLSTDASPEAVSGLLALYHRARFSAHPVGTPEIIQARAYVAELSKGWRTFDDALRTSVS